MTAHRTVTPPPGGGDLLEIRELFARANYSETSCAEILAVSGPQQFVRAMPLRAPAEPDGAAGGAASPLHCLVTLFLQRKRLSRRAVSRLIGPRSLDVLVRASLAVEGPDGSIAGAVAVYPVGDLLITTDWPVVAEPGSLVSPVHGPTYRLAASLSRRPVERALDMCSGSGVLAIVASRHARRVVAVDINPRAVDFARFNAAVNGARNVEVVEGSLYEPVPAESFARIVANPPFHPTPFSPAGSNFWSGGRSGEEVLAPLLRGLVQRLEGGGIAQVMTLLVHRGADDAVQRCLEWLGEGCEVLFCLDPVESPLIDPAPERWGEPKAGAWARLQSLLERDWRRQGISGFEFGFLIVRRAEHTRWRRLPAAAADGDPVPLLDELSTVP